MGDFFAPWHLLIIATMGSIYVALILVPFWQIFKKAGKGGAMSILMIVPLVNVIMLYYLAFSKWGVPPSE